MSMNIGNPMMGMNSMMPMSNSMGMSGSSENINQYYQLKYGCADCFRSQPYLQEYPKPIIPWSKEEIETNIFKQFFRKIFG